MGPRDVMFFFLCLFFSFRPPALILLSDPDEKQRKKPHGLSIFFTVLYLDAKKNYVHDFYSPSELRKKRVEFS